METSIDITEKSNVLHKTIYSILFSISFAHLLNDLIQAIIPSVYPILKQNYNLTFTQIGLITFAFQLSASLLQPLVGYYTDKYPKPFSQVYGMLFSLIGIVFLSFATNFYWILISVIFIGIGSSIFHPESARISNLASGGKRGLAQSIFQVGGNFGTALGPLLVALIVVPNGQVYILWFIIAAVMGLAIISKIAFWYHNHLIYRKPKKVVLVSVIDSGVDPEHEDLKDVMWVNDGEIAGNGIDDDKNGYVDDIYGWNFLGGNGDAAPEQLEITRIVAKLNPRFEGKTMENIRFID